MNHSYLNKFVSVYPELVKCTIERMENILFLGLERSGSLIVITKRIYVIKLTMVRVNSITGKILEIDESILSVALLDMRGKSSYILAINL